MKSEQTNEIFAALAKAQAEMKAPPKDKTATVPMKAGGQYTYKYSDLATVIDTVKPALAKHGLAVSHLLETIGIELNLVTFLTHSSGQWLSSKLPLSSNLPPQQLGSEITYMRRYALAAILGVASDDDTDAADVEKKPPQAPAKKPAIPARAAVAQAPKKEAPVGVAAPETEDDQCENCGVTLVMSRYKPEKYCPNYKDLTRGAHTRIALGSVK